MMHSICGREITSVRQYASVVATTDLSLIEGAYVYSGSVEYGDAAAVWFYVHTDGGCDENLTDDEQKALAALIEGGE